MLELYEKLKEKSPIRLQWLLEGRDRHELIAIFLGMLELRAPGRDLAAAGRYVW